MDDRPEKKGSKSKLICRLCLNNLFFECAISIFENKDNNLDLQVLISKYVQLELSIDDTISTSICQNCFDHLEDFHQFYRNVDQKQKSLQQNIFDFLEVKCENIEGEDVEKKDEIPQDFLDIVQSDEQADDSFALNNENENAFMKKEKKLLSKFKTEETDYSSDDDTPLTELYDIPNHKRDTVEETSLEEDINELEFNIKTKTKTKKIKSKETVTETTPKELSARSLVLADCELRCEMCNVEIGNFDKLKQHFEKRHRHKKVFIMCCGHKYTARKSIGIHLHRHRDPDKFKCSICEKQFSSTTYLRGHMKVRHDSEKAEPMKCTLCDREFKLIKSYKKHMINHEKGEIKDKPKSKEPVQCDQCSRSFSSETRLKHHRKIMHAVVLPYQCDACDESFLTKQEEDNHRPTCKNRELAQNAAKGIASRETNSQETICQICFKLFPTFHALRAHISSIHENIHNYICEQCGKKFKLKASLEKHQLSHQGIVEPPAQCETCGKWLKSESSLRVHRYMHDNSFNKCSLCEHVSTTRRALRLHVKKVHRAEHNFHCQYCEKSFKNSTYLEEHMAIHTGAQLYACPHCGKESRSRSNMYAHVKRMHPEEWLRNQLARSHNPDLKSQLIKLN